MTTWRSLLQKTKTYELSKSLSTGESYTVAVDQEPVKPLEVWLGNTYYGDLADDLTVTPTAPHKTLTLVSFYNPVIQTVMLNSGTLPTAYTRAPEDIEADIEAAQARADEANQRSQTNEVTITDMGLTVTQHSTDINDLETLTQSQTAEITAQGVTITDHSTRLDTVETTTGSHVGLIQTLTNTQTAHGTSISAISSDLDGLTRQHHGLPPPTTYKTGDRWALKAYTNADLSSYTNAQLQAWGIRNAMLSGGELLATRGRTDSYAASDWTWIATSGTELSRIDRLLTDIQAGRIQLSSLTQLPGGGWQIGNFAIHDYNRSRWQHSDGSYTQIGSSPGLEQYIAGRGHRYHNLMYVTTVSGQDTLTKWVQLPDEFKGKPFEVYMALSDSAEHVPAGGDAGLDNRSAIRRLVATVSPEATIDRAEARVPYMCYKLSVNIHTVINEPLVNPWRVTRAIGIMIAIA